MTPKQAEIYALVKAAPDGINVDDICVRIGCAKTTAQTHLQQLGQCGQLTAVIASKRSVWCTPDRYDSIASAIKAAVYEAKKARKRAWNKKHPTRDRGNPMASLGDGGGKVVQRRVPAAQAAPIVTRAVSSVWEWGRA